VRRLEFHEITVGVQRTSSEVPVRDDVTGLGRPAPGYHLFGARVRACVRGGAAIKQSDWGVDVDGARVKFPASNYADDFEAAFAGDCREGWIVFEIPDGKQPKAVTFAYDDTGSARPGDQQETHARFRWTF
jgi:hypothetical protein